ncbi:MAG: acyltransferase family protein [Anaerovoracaceae bacterium]
MEKTKRTTSIELLRFVAAIGVMIAHFGGIYLSKGNYDPVTYLFKTLADIPLEAKRSYAPFGFVFVEFFFMIGGFFMLKYLDGRKDPLNPGGYILKKVKSFYPIFIVAFSAQMIFYVLLNNFKGVSGFFEALFHFKWEALLLHCTGFLKDPAFNLDYLLGQDWYLSALVLGLIIIYPIALYYRNFFEKIFVPWSTIILYALLIQKYGTLDVGSEYLGVVSTAMVRGVAGLTAGCLAYIIYRSIKEKEFSKVQLKILAVIEILMWLSVPILFTNNIIATESDVLFYVPVLIGIIILAFLDKTPLSGFLNSHFTGFFGYLGGLSLYMYLFHWTVMTAMNYFVPQLSPLLATTAYFAITIGLSAVMFEVNKRRKTALPIVILVVIFLGTSLVTAVMA